MSVLCLNVCTLYAKYYDMYYVYVLKKLHLVKVCAFEIDRMTRLLRSLIFSLHM